MPPARWEADAGAEQPRRLPAAMREGYFSVDERSLADLVSTSARFAGSLAFFDARDVPDGDWGRWFEMDEAFVLARIAAADVGRWRTEFLGIADTLPVGSMLSPIRRVALRIDGWLRTLGSSQHPPAVAIHGRIRQLIEQRLATELNWAIAHSKTATPEDFVGLDEIWKVGTRPAVALITRADAQERAVMRTVFFDFIDAVEQFRDAAREQLQESLARDTHEPSAGLFLAFLHLYQVAQKHVNRFSARLIEFYHGECLRIAPRKAEPRSVYLVCRRAPGDQQVTVPRGATLALGRDSAGREVRYRADETLHVTPVAVAALQTVRLDRDTRTSPERELGYVTRARARSLPVVAADSPAGARRREWWPLFGGSLPGAADDGLHDADLGLAIASPELLLGEGAREVRIGLNLGHPADLDVEAAELVRRFVGATPEVLSVPDDIDSRSDVVNELFERYAALERRFGAGQSATDAPKVTPEEKDILRARVLRNARRGGYDAHAAYSHYLLRPVPESTDRARLGRLFARWMLVDPDTLLDSDIDAIRKASTSHRSEPLERSEGQDILAYLRESELPARKLREFLFGRFMTGLFEVSLTGRDGWFSPNGTVAVWEASAQARERGHVGLVFRLGADAPAVVAYDSAVHGGGWPTRLPVARVRLNPAAALFPLSPLADLVLSSIDIAVDVKGARGAVLHNNFGRLDPSKPFNPFGPMPARGSYMIFGSPEAARKKLTSLALNVEWGGLPDDDGGFPEHYRGYSGTFGNRAFRIATTVLSDGQWQPRADSAPGQTLFDACQDDGRVPESSRIIVDEAALRNYYCPLRGAGASGEFGFDLTAREGFFKITLTDPADTFGHREYPQLLTKVVSENARRRRQLPIPNAPYTPLIERLTFDYRSRCSIDLVRQSHAERAASEGQVLLMHPFGFEEIYPAGHGALKGPVPRFERDGSLFIGLKADEAPGRVTLLFYLNEESARRRVSGIGESATAWFYLASNQWRALEPARVVADTTHGFLATGIVTLDLPEDISRGNTILPPGLYWLCVGADRHPGQFAGLYGVTAQAFCATQVESAAGDGAEAPPTAAGTAAEPLGSIPGLVRLTQAGSVFGGRPAESREQLGARAGERLRHKNRASVAWDYERLVLERFPRVFKVKCFAGVRGDSQLPAAAPAPGSVTVVVVPAPQAATPDEARAPQMTGLELEEIRDWLAARRPPFASIWVRNAVYERVQVRCAVRFRNVLAGGQLLQRLNQDIIDRLSPWRAGGEGAQFGWTLRAQEIEGWIRNLDYVDAVAKVSLLHVAEDDQGLYWLGDSARAAGAGHAVRSSGVLRPTFPWGIAVPMRQHLIERMTAGARPDDPQATGIAAAETEKASGLGIGTTFVVARGRDG